METGNNNINSGVEAPGGAHWGQSGNRSPSIQVPEESNPHEHQGWMRETQRFAHDLRAPVFALQGVLRSFEKDSERLESSDRILLEESARRLLDMSESYLKYCREEKHRAQHSKLNQHLDQSLNQGLNQSLPANSVAGPEEINLIELRSHLRKQLREFRLRHNGFLEGKKLRLTWRDYLSLQVDHELGICSEGVLVTLNSMEFRRMLSNLLDNAAESVAKTEEIQILVSTYLENKTLYIELQDNGMGMDPRQINHALQGVSSKPTGNGLGLTQAQRMLKQWGARLKIDSKQSVGTTVVLSFPLQVSSLH